MPPAPHVVIVGGGFGGLQAARGLRRAPVRITLLDRSNHHLFQPLLYQVATAALNPSDIAAPIRSILRSQQNVTVYLHEVTSIDRLASRVMLTDGSMSYDYLILATGVTHAYFGHDEWEASAPGLKSIDDALRIRNRFLLAYERAESESDPLRRREWLTFVVVGGGPTGVELAGALAEIARQTMIRDFRHFDPSEVRVILVEGIERVLPPYPPSLSEKARHQLERLGVEVRTGAQVAGISPEGVRVGDEWIPCRTTLWAAGVKASPLARSLGVALDRVGRVLVEPDLTVPGSNNLFVIGDLAHLEQDGKLVPGVAPAAMQMGRHTAGNIVRAAEGSPMLPFRYRDKGSLATIGRLAGVADFGWIRLGGPIAWLAWLGIHIFFLIGFRNRLLVLIQWTWAYLTYQRGARLITHPEGSRERT